MIDNQALMFAGITPPPPGKHYTTCPQCSHRRKKSQERCLMVKTRGWITQVFCQHCRWDAELM